jgi:putative endonuclease
VFCVASSSTRIRVGAHGEQLAADHLERAGYRVLERNARCGRTGELDIVARSERCMVFCEVKTRVAGTIAGPDGPLDAIGPVKRRRLRRLAGEWLRTRPQEAGGPAWIRFDAIGVTVDRGGALLAVDHVEDAF